VFLNNFFMYFKQKLLLRRIRYGDNTKENRNTLPEARE